MQAYLEPKNWKTELEYWFAVRLARLRLEIFNTIKKPPGFDDSVAYNQIEGTELKPLCEKVKLDSPNHAAMSTASIIIILVVVALLLVDTLVDTVLSKVLGTCAKRIIKDGTMCKFCSYQKMLRSGGQRMAGLTSR